MSPHDRSVNPWARGNFIAGGMVALLLAGCASARMSDKETDRLFERGQYDQAAQRLKKGVEDQGENGRDVLLYLLDLGLTLHSAGHYEESDRVFEQANQMAEIKDYTSLSREGATLLTSDNIKDYKAEDFENVLINTYLAMNYALQGNNEDALVEARRVNQKLYMMVSEGKRKYKQNAFARYLSAILYEEDGDYDDAYVDYKNTHDLDPGYPGLGRDLWRMAKLTETTEDLEKWDEEYALTAADHKAASQLMPRAGKGEIVVLYENGISPIKRPNPSFRELPKFYPRFNPVSYAIVGVRPQNLPPDAPDVQVPTAMLYNIEAAAIENLDEKWGGLLAKKLAGIAAKEAVGYAVAKETHSPILGLLTKLVLFASDQADVRSWNLLPRDLQIARIAVDPGAYFVQVRPVGGPAAPPQAVQVAAGKKVFVNARYMP